MSLRYFVGQVSRAVHRDRGFHLQVDCIVSLNFHWSFWFFCCCFTDIDECTEAALNAVDLCETEPNTECLNTEGSFECICAPGFIKMNDVCQLPPDPPPPPPPPQCMIPTMGILHFISSTLTVNDVRFCV